MAKIILNVTTNIKQAQDDVKKLKNLVNNLGTAFNKMKANKDVTEQIKSITALNKSLVAAVEKTVKINNQNALANEKLAQAQAKTAAQTAKAAEAEAKATTAKIKSADATGKLHITEEKLEQAQIKTAKAAESLEKAQKKNAEAAEDSNKKQKGLVETLMQFSITAKLVQSGVRLIKSAYSDLNETLADTERRIIAIQRVLPNGSVADQDLANRLYDLAIEYGQSFGNVSDIATNFARTGLSYADTIQATRAALLALNVAELDSTQATEGMIAIMAQFSMSAEEMETVVDKLNKVADRFPVTTEKLLTALQRMGSAASNAGLTLDDSIGLVTALSQATGRGGQNIGTALNSLIQYSKKDKALGIYSSLSTDMAAIVNQYKIGAASILDVWRGLSVEINKLSAEQSYKLDELANYYSTGEGAGLKDALESELGDIFNDVNSIYSTANAHRQNYFIALLNNMETVSAATEAARDAEGYSIKENEKEMQTYEKRVAALQEHWHKLANDEQGWLAFRKGLVEIGDVLLTVVEWTGGLRTAAIALGTAFAAAFAPKIIASVKEFVAALQSANAAMSSSIGWIGLVITAVIGLTSAIKHYQDEQHDARLQTIETWQTTKDTAAQLNYLYVQYKNLSPKTAEFKTVEEQLLGILGSKVSVLEDLTKGTDEYRSAIEKLAEAEIEESMRQSAAAAKAAKEEAAKSRIFDSSYLGDYGDVQRDLRLLGYTGDDANSILNGMFGRRQGQTNQQYNIDNYLTAKSAKNRLYSLANEELRSGKISTSQYEERISSRLLKKLDEYTAELEPIIETYLETAAAEYIQTYLFVNDLAGLDKTNIANAKQFVESSFYAQNGVAPSNYLTDALLKYVDEYARLSDTAKSGVESTTSALKEQSDTLDTIENKYQSIVDAINAGREAEKEAEKAAEKHNAVLQAQLKLEEAILKAKSDYVKTVLNQYLNGQKTENEIADRRQNIADAELQVEEKKKAVQEAQIALQKAQDDLEYARRNRTERVFNTTTGMWEYQANQKTVQSEQEKVREATEKVAAATKDVEKAENDVQKAVENLEKYLQDQAVDDIIAAIENGGVTSEQIDEIFKKWFGDGGGQWGDGVKNVILKAQTEADKVYLDNDNVKKAYENLASAQKSEQEYLRDQAYSSLINRITSGNKLTRAEWAGLEKSYRSMGMSDNDISWLYNLLKNGNFFDTNPRLDQNFENHILGREADFVNIIELLKDIVDNTGAAVDISLGQEPIIKAGIHAHEELLPGANAGTYDSGGVLYGKGGIKATNRPELVIDPELTRRILTPANSDAFERFVANVGAIYGAPLKSALSPSYANNWQNASTNDNRSYVINGVPIPKEAAQNYTIAELFENMQLV